MYFKSMDGISLYYETYGEPSNTPVILIHGIGADNEMWSPQKSTLKNAGYFVIIPDIRGHGKSDIPPKFTITECANDIIQLITQLKLKKANLVGVSMGGMIVQQFTSNYPEMVISQIIVDSLSGISTNLERLNAYLALLILKFLPKKTQASLIKNAYKKMGHINVGEYFENRIMSMDQKWLLNARKEVNSFNIFNKLSTISTSTLILVGDSFGKLAINMAYNTHIHIKGSTFTVIKNGGDPSNLLEPYKFDKLLLDYLNKPE